jgi:hypothetical protein
MMWHHAVRAKEVPDGAASSGPLLTLEGLNVKDIEMELTGVSGYHALQISRAKKW